MTELWKPIPGYEGIYEASSLGRIRTAPGKTTSNAHSPHRVWKSRIMKPKAEKGDAYRQDLRLTLYKDGRPKYFLVARLVASAWHGPPRPGDTVNHKNGDYLDNRPENLEWCPLADNIRHGYDTGLYDSVMIAVSLVRNGYREDFRSLSAASRFLGRSIGYVSARIKNGSSVAYSSTGEAFTIV